MKVAELREKLEPLSGFRGKAIDTTGDQWRHNKEGELELKHGGRYYKPTQHAVKNALGMAGVPTAFAKKLPSDLLEANMNWAWGQLGSVNLVQEKQGGTLVAVAPPNARIIPANRIVDKVEQVVHPEDYDRCYVRDGVIELYAVGAKQSAVNKGDLVAGGVYVRFSPWGTTAEQVRAFYRRLVCTNGAMSIEEGANFTFTGGDGGSFNGWLKDALKAAYGSVGAEVERLKAMSKERINPSEVADHVLRMKMPEETRSLIRSRIMDRNVRTAYDLYNIITETASHDVEDPDIVYRLMNHAPTVANHRDCPVCHRQIAKRTCSAS